MRYLHNMKHLFKRSRIRRSVARNRKMRFLCAFEKAPLYTKRAIGCSILVAAVASLLAVAQADDDSLFKPRVYVGAGVGATMLEPKSYNSALTVSDNTDSGYHIAAGYDFSTRLSAEVYAADLGQAGVAFLGTEVDKVDYQVYGISALAWLFNSRSGFSGNSSTPGLSQRQGLSVFTRVGLGGVNADSGIDLNVDHGSHVALGLGAEYGFDNGFALRTEYMALDTDQHYANVSLVKRFGSARQALPVAALAPADPAPVSTIASEPEKQPASVELAFTPTTVLFDFDRSELKPAAIAALDAGIAALRSGQTIQIDGHADSTGTDAYNVGLSMRRANSVRRYLVAKGIDAQNITVQGFGEARPVASNMTPAGRQQNRRAVVRIK